MSSLALINQESTSVVCNLTTKTPNNTSLEDKFENKISYSDKSQKENVKFFIIFKRLYFIEILRRNIKL